MEKVVLVTGATGAVGSVLVHRLLERGYRVRTLSRTLPLKGSFLSRESVPRENATIEKNLTCLAGDITKPEDVEIAVKGVYAVFHLAARLHDSSLDERNLRLIKTVNFEGTRHLIHGAEKNGVEKIVFFSTINVYTGRSSQRIFDEQSPVNPLSCYASSKLAAEKILLQANADEKNNLSCTILRVAAVYGRGMKGNYRRLLQMLQKGIFVRLGSGENCRTLIHVEDLADAAILALEHPGAGGEIFNATDGVFYTYNCIIASIVNALGKKVWTISFSDATAKGLIRILKVMATVRFPLALRVAGLIEKQMESIKVSGDKIRRVLGFNPRYTLKNGWKEIL